MLEHKNDDIEKGIINDAMMPGNHLSRAVHKFQLSKSLFFSDTVLPCMFSGTFAIFGKATANKTKALHLLKSIPINLMNSVAS